MCSLAAQPSPPAGFAARVPSGSSGLPWQPWCHLVHCLQLYPLHPESLPVLTAWRPQVQTLPDLLGLKLVPSSFLSQESGQELQPPSSLSWGTGLSVGSLQWMEDPVSIQETTDFNKAGRNVASRKLKVLVAQLCPTLCEPVDCSPPGTSVHGILQARILKWVVISFSRGSS